MEMGKQTILIVDDTPANIEILSEVLSNEYEVLFATCGQDALNIAFDQNPDLILLDVNMPGLSGIEVVKKLLDSPETRQIPVLVLTATDYNTGTESLFRKEKNVKGFMTKLAPIDAIKGSLLRNLRRKE